MPIEDWNGRISATARAALKTEDERRSFAQLRAFTILRDIGPDDAELPRFTFLTRERELTELAYLQRLAELARPKYERRKRPGSLVRLAEIFEDLARFNTAEQNRRIELLTQAAAMWSLAGYQANATVLAGEVTRLLDTLASDQTMMRLLRLTSALLGRDVSGSLRLGQAAVSSIPLLSEALMSERDSREGFLAEAALIAAYGLTGRAAAALVNFWRRGSDKEATRALSELATARKLLLDANIVDAWMLLDNLHYVVEDAIFASTWHQLRGGVKRWNALWQRHLRLMSTDKPAVVEVWPSQRLALSRGFLDPKRKTMVVKMPTSAGKTHLAEFAILASVADAALVVYVVPSRALAAEVERKLAKSLGRLGLSVSAIFGGFEHVDYEHSLLEMSNVLVVTAEKLDLLLRQDSALAERLSLVILDEGHLVGETSRGLGYEFLVTRLRRRAEQARIVFLSAVLPNERDIAAWLEPDASGQNVISDDWTPSRINLGIFRWVGVTQDGQSGTVRYEGEEAYFLPHILKKKKAKTRCYPFNKSQTAAELALHYQLQGPVLIGAATKPLVESVAKALSESIKRRARTEEPMALVSATEQKALSTLASTIAETTGSNHPLLKYVEQGFAFHHAGLPEVVRKSLESAYRQGALKILVATSTLSQGVNLPTKTVIVSHVQRGQNDKMAVRDFYNLIGRANRAFEETEGHVVLVAMDEREATRLRKRYLSKANIESVQSQLKHLYQALVRRRLPSTLAALHEIAETEDLEADHFDDEPAPISRLDIQLLALLAEEVVDTLDEASIEKVLGATLCAVQLSNEGIPLRPLARYVSKRLTLIQSRISDSKKRAAYYRTGLGLDSCDALFEQVAHMLLSEPDLTAAERSEAFVERLLEAVTDVPEIARTCTDLDVPPSALPWLAKRWLAGEAVQAIHSAYETAFAPMKAEKFTGVIERLLTRDLPWLLSSAIEFTKYVMPDEVAFVPQITSLPAMAKFGVPTYGACYAASSGVANRADALKIGAAFIAQGGGSLTQFIRWLNALSTNDIAILIGDDGGRVRDVVGRAATLGTSRNALQLLSLGEGTVTVELRDLELENRLFNLMELEPFAELILGREKNNPSDPNAMVVRTARGDDIGYLARDLAYVIAVLFDEGKLLTAKLINSGFFPETFATVEVQVFADE